MNNIFKAIISDNSEFKSDRFAIIEQTKTYVALQSIKHSEFAIIYNNVPLKPKNSQEWKKRMVFKVLCDCVEQGKDLEYIANETERIYNLSTIAFYNCY